MVVDVLNEVENALGISIRIGISFKLVLGEGFHWILVCGSREGREWSGESQAVDGSYGYASGSKGAEAH